MSHVEVPPRLVSFTVIATGAAIVVLFVAGAVGAYLKHGFRLVPFLSMFPVFLGGLFVLLYGITRLFHRKVITIHYNMVELTEIRMWKRFHWREPLFNYTKVEKCSRHLTLGGDTSARTEYEVLLAHPNAKKSVRLFYSLHRRDWESTWLAFARLLNLPAAEHPEPPPELLPVQSRQSEHREFGNRIWIDETADTIRVRHSRVWSSWPASLGIIFTGFLYLAVSSRGGAAAAEVPVTILLAFFSLFFIIFLLQVFSTEELVLTPRTIHFRIHYPWGASTKKTLERATIRRVFVKVDPLRMHLPSIVCIDGPDGIVHFGRYATETDKQKLRDFLSGALHAARDEAHAKGA